MHALTAIGGVVVIGLIGLGVYFLARNIRIRSGKDTDQ